MWGGCGASDQSATGEELMGTGPALCAQLLCNCPPEKGKRKATVTMEENVACFQCIFAFIISVHHLLHFCEISFFISVLGLHGKVLIAWGLQGWLL